MYYINLKTEIPFKDKLLLSKKMVESVPQMLSGINFDCRYIRNHSKEEYLKIGSQIIKKVKSNDYLIEDGKALFFLGD